MQKNIHGFILQKSQEIPELHTSANLYIHAKTKAQLLSLINSDENKSFGITFRTPPSDSTGIAHILEHSVLCGSKNYPLKEPFIELVKGSLHTFLNAFTYPDKTSYPVASTNETDFYNLTRVYLDAVFFPLLSEETLMQEGWHIHQESAKTDPQYRGIVFNEMKGAYSSPDRALSDAIQRSLLPDTPYAHDSGGDPLEIPNLKYADFLAFHRKYYHPSNSLIFFSGNDSEIKRLELADEYLSQFEHQDIDTHIPLQPSFASPVQLTAPLAIAQSEDPLKKAVVTLNWALPSVTARDLSMRLKILSHILVGTAASPLRKRLIESGIGEDIAGGGIEGDIQQMLFSIGLKGMDERQAKRVETIILSTLRELVAAGIAQDTIDAAMNSTEFALREQNSGSFPRGLSMLYTIVSAWQYGGDPIEALAFAKIIEQLKSELAAGVSVFTDLIRTYLLENTHRSLVILQPDPAEQKRRDEAEQMSLAASLKGMSPQDRKQLVRRTQQLIQLQTAADSKEKLALLPKLGRSDLETDNIQIPLEITKQKQFQLLTHPLETNGIIYLDLVFDLSAVPQSLLGLLPLFSRALVEMGTAQESYDQFVNRINKQSGGIWTQTFVYNHVGMQDVVAKLIVRAKCLESQAQDLKALLSNVLHHANLGNKDRFLQMLLEEKSDMEQAVLESGHAFVDYRLRRQLAPCDQVDEVMGGVEQLFFLRTLVDRVHHDWKSVQADLKQLRTLIITSGDLIANVTSDPQLQYLGANLANELIEKLPERGAMSEKWTWDVPIASEVLIAPTTVNYVGKGANLYDAGYNLDGSALVISRYLRSSWLWEQVRMKGGAYGAFSTFDPLTGSYTFLSYRDPHITETITAFDQSSQWLQEIHLSEDELTKAIIGTISDFDHYMLPDAKGMASLTRYLVGMTDAKRAKLRAQILSTSEKDFHIFGKVLETINAGSTVVLTSDASAISDMKPTSIQIL